MQVSSRGISTCWGTHDFIIIIITIIIPHHQTEGHHSPTIDPHFKPPVADLDWESWEQGDGDRGIRIAALSHGRNPLPGVWSSLASCPGSMPRKLGSSCTTAFGVPLHFYLYSILGFRSPLPLHIQSPVAGVTRSRATQWRWAQMLVLMNHLRDTWPWLISSFCGKTTELIFILVPDFKDRLCQALWIIGNKALFFSLRHVSVQSNKSHKGKKMLHFRDSFFLQS